MTTIKHNHANYQARLDFIQQRILAEHLGLSGKDLEQAKVSPIQYDPDCPFKYNNFVYHIELSSPLTSDITRDEGKQQQKQHHGCVPIPADTTDFILRLSNQDAEGMHRATRVENEVALISLASAALRHIKPAVVPEVYGWGSAAASQGWILQRRMPGNPVDESFKVMTLDQKQGILAQMATLLKGLQDYQLPESVTGWGGISFGPDGRYVSAPMTSVGAGPWASLEESFRSRLQVALDKADANSHIQGWRTNGVRERLDAFLERGLSAKLASLASKSERTIIHADFTTNNLLFDPASGRITALLDYDFASILHPSYEFLRSFDGVGGQFRGWSGDEDNEDAAMRTSKLTGTFPSPLPANSDAFQWDVAKMWEDELERQQAKRPSTITGIAEVADVDAVLRAVLPWHISNSDFLSMQGDRAAEYFRKRGEAELVKLLGHLGF